jgi:hypothetical protein
MTMSYDVENRLVSASGACDESGLQGLEGMRAEATLIDRRENVASPASTAANGAQQGRSLGDAGGYALGRGSEEGQPKSENAAECIPDECITVTGHRRSSAQFAQLDIPPGPNGLAEWFYNNMRDAARYRSNQAKAYLKNCASNLGNVDAGQVAQDAAAGGLAGGAKGAARGAVMAGGVGPEGAAIGAAINGAKGITTCTMAGAGKSVISQACSE